MYHYLKVQEVQMVRERQKQQQQRVKVMHLVLGQLMLMVYEKVKEMEKQMEQQLVYQYIHWSHHRNSEMIHMKIQVFHRCSYH